MARVKLICRGKNTDGSPCKNWAIKGSFYCSRHQYQVSEKDNEDMRKANLIGAVVMILLIIVVLIISLIAGCEKEFFKYISK